jgi:hypothetical protein
MVEGPPHPLTQEVVDHLFSSSVVHVVVVAHLFHRNGYPGRRDEVSRA